MPNTGKPSGGCHACRRMKVRCDETRPGCQRCARARRVCPGYRSPTDGRFRSMNEQAQQPGESSSRSSSRRRRGARDAAAEDSGSNRATPPIHSSSALVTALSYTTSAAMIPAAAFESGLESPRPTTDWEATALARFFVDYVILENDPDAGLGQNAGFYHFLQEMYEEQNLAAGRGQAVHLVTATRAVACAAFANRTNATALTMQARRYYGRALAAVQVALNDPIEALRDESLTAVTLLSLYEVV